MTTLTMANGEPMEFILTYKTVHRVGKKNPKIVNAYFTAINGQAKDGVEMMDMMCDILYLGYLCKNVDDLDIAMSQDAFEELLPDDMNEIAKAMMELISPNLQSAGSALRSSQKRKSTRSQ